MHTIGLSLRYTKNIIIINKRLSVILSMTATSALSQAPYGQGTGDILLDDLFCIGTEASLFDCPNNGVGVHNCAHSEDAGAICEGTTKWSPYKVNQFGYILINICSVQ